MTQSRSSRPGLKPHVPCEQQKECAAGSSSGYALGLLAYGYVLSTCGALRGRFGEQDFPSGRSGHDCVTMTQQNTQNYKRTDH